MYTCLLFYYIYDLLTSNSYIYIYSNHISIFPHHLPCQAFAQDKFGPLKNCPSGGDWEAILVEAEMAWKSQEVGHVLLRKVGL